MKQKLLSLLFATIVWAGFTATPALTATQNTGQHIHFEVLNHPVDGFPIPQAPYTFHVVIKSHMQTGVIRWFRLDDWDKAGPNVAVNLGPCDDCQVSLDYTVNFSTWAAGRHELRWHADIGQNNDGNRQYTTARAQVCIVNCTNVSPNNRAKPFNGGGSWYFRYATVYLTSADTDIKPGGFIKIRAAQDAERVCALLNPDIHHGSSGTILGCWSDTATRTVSLAGAAVGDKVLIGAIDTTAGTSLGNAGWERLIVGDGSPRAVTDYEFQSWWAKGGVVLP